MVAKKLIGNEALSVLQKTELDILKALDSYCRKRNLIYYLAYGTLLGSVRHGGFIPWDDDVDICMPRRDYEQLLNEFDEYFSNQYLINHYSKSEYTTNSYIIRICNKSVKFSRKINGEDKLFDSFISIFPIDGMPKGFIRRKIFEKKIDINYIYLRFVRSSQNGYGNVNHSMGERLGILVNTIFKIGTKKDIRAVAKKLDEALAKYSIDESTYVSTYGYMVTPMTFKKDFFGIPKEYPFEENSFLGPENAHELMKIWYGNYLQLPPVEKRKPSHSLDVYIVSDE